MRTMNFSTIDLEHWERREYFEHYLNQVPCTYSMTTKLDITKIRQEGRRLYPTMLYLLTKTVNQFEQFRTAFRPDGSLVIYEQLSPSYTIFHPQTETFSTLWTEYSGDYTTFCRRYEEDLARYGKIERMVAKPDQPENCFDVSMIPWNSFDGFNLNVAGFRHLLPIFTLGKYREVDGRWLIPISAQVHHAVCDGFHLCRMLEELQRQLDENLL